MSRSLLALTVTALVLAASASGGLPKAGALVPGRSLGGIRLGESPGAVRAALGSFYGACRDCPRRTWYFTYHPFAKRGLAVEFNYMSLADAHYSAVASILPAGLNPGPRLAETFLFS